jgi:enediyne biosynthesis protein E4
MNLRRAAVYGTLALLAAGIALFRFGSTPNRPGNRTPARGERERWEQEIVERVLSLEAAERERAEAEFKAELANEPALAALTTWWDRLHRSDRPLSLMAETLPGRIALAANANLDGKPDRVVETTRTILARELNREAMRRQIAEWQGAGWELRRSRWYLLEWNPTPPSSRIRFELLLSNAIDQHRLSLRGEFLASGGTGWVEGCDRIEVQTLEVLRSEDRPAFEVAGEFALPVPPHTPFCDPLISVPRVDGRGDDLLMVGAALWLRNHSDGWKMEPLPGLPAERVWAATAADWNQDGHADLLLAGSDGLRVLPGPEWKGPGQLLWRPAAPWRHPQVIAFGDIDRDGSPDVFVGQYKLPYQGGQFPTPYHAANDGFESVLLRGHPDGTFRDATAEWGLEQRRRRRLYSASFADWNDDGLPDLILVSDFAGVDLFRNTGTGRFEEVTAPLGDARHLFGMAHITGDFNDDGRTDLYAIGMGSPTAERLHRMGLVHAAWPEDQRFRRAMTYGNRLFLGGPSGLQPAPWADAVSSGGWAWAVTALDVDNNGTLDFHLCQGHETRASTRDYERQFWMHDIHVAQSTNNPVTDIYFRNAAGRRAADQASYGGWQDGALLLQERPGQFIDAAWLAGTSIAADTRNAVAFNLDGDGRMDLAVTTFEEWPQRRQRLILLRNRHPETGAWIGFEFEEGTVEARVRVRSGGITRERRITPGESYRSQSVGRIHVGLGHPAPIDGVELIRPGKQIQRLDTCVPNRWNRIPRGNGR